MNRTRHPSPTRTRLGAPGRAWARVFGLTLLLGSATGARCAEEGDELTATKLEYQVKAGFIFNFAKFVEWPSNAPVSATFRIAVLDDGPAFNVLSNELSGKVLAGKTVEVARIQLNELPCDCRIVFVTKAQSAKAAEVPKRLGNAPVLTIGECDRFAEHGGSINFTRKGDKIRFEINLAAAEQAKLKISSKLSSIATLVKPKEATK